jgi:DNA polymerase III epsilon subunit family exonuclease
MQKNHIHSFVVLDLETTGLDTDNDTIIEIAAIRFTLTKDNNSKWQAIEQEERSMLINPLRDLSEEISLITHITDNMLLHKPVWRDVQEKVREFIQGSVIVGHNVLFDVAMLKTHGIDLTDAIILDTFELSELFSPESESLNLGFLWAKYGIETDKWEHRALWDVEICLGLFLRYLWYMENIDKENISMLRLIASKEAKENIGFLLTLLWMEGWEIYSLWEKYGSAIQKREENESEKSEEIKKVIPRIVSLWSDKNDEIALISEILEESSQIHFLTTGHKVSHATKKMIEDAWYNPIIWIRKEKFCSVRYIEECIHTEDNWERKLSILICRILFWLKWTKSWLIGDLKIYWKEYEYIDNFRMESDEENIFSSSYTEKLNHATIVIYDMYDYLQMQHWKPEHLIIKDIWFLDDKMRRALSTWINLTELIYETWELIWDVFLRERLIHSLSFIQHIYEWIPTRPTGNAEFPPWEFGETYFFDQETLWKKWGVWLLLTTRRIDTYMDQITIDNNISSTKKKRLRNLIQSLEFLIQYHNHTSPCTSIVIEIKEEGTIIKYIPRNLEKPLKQIFTLWAKWWILLYWYGIDGKKISTFLEGQLSLTWIPKRENIQKKHELAIIESLNEISIQWWVILTTSMKNIREIGKVCDRMWIRTLMQWISGGKSKIQSLFHNALETTVLIWLIDSWKDEHELWKEARSLVIAKLPFDPPNDPYFLARTVWMSNNFTFYSEPMVILRINTLIWRIRSMWYNGHIYTLDNRLLNTTWWSEIYQDIL